MQMGAGRSWELSSTAETWVVPGPSRLVSTMTRISHPEVQISLSGRGPLSLVNNVLTLVQNTAVTVIKNPPRLVCQCSFHRKSVIAWRSICRDFHLGPRDPRVGDGRPDAALGSWLGPKPRHLCWKQRGLLR